MRALAASIRLPIHRRSRRRWLSPVSLVLAAVLSSAVSAAPIVTGIHRTGEGVVPVVPVAASQSSRSPRAPTATPEPIDRFWQVVALPQTPTIVPYEAAVFSGRGPGFAVPQPWYQGAEGIAGAGWVGLRLETTNSLFPPAVGRHSDYSAIYATRFTASESGRAFFDLTATADNTLSFFVNGSITGQTTLLPSIVGGTQIGVEMPRLDRLHSFQGFADVNAGENTLYAVVRDRYVLDPNTNIGGWGQTGLFVAAVPEPGSLVLAVTGAAVLLVGRRFRRRACAMSAVRTP
jgi:hypothetical protein